MTQVRQHNRNINGKIVSVKQNQRKEPIKSSNQIIKERNDKIFDKLEDEKMQLDLKFTKLNDKWDEIEKNTPISEVNYDLREKEFKQLRDKELKPFLEKLYNHREKSTNLKPQFKENVNTDDKSTLLYISPKKFLKLAHLETPSMASLYAIREATYNQDKLPIPYLEYNSSKNKITSQEGRHRALTSVMFNQEKIPVKIYSSKKNINELDIKYARPQATQEYNIFKG